MSLGVNTEGTNVFQFYKDIALSLGLPPESKSRGSLRTVDQFFSVVYLIGKLSD